MALYFEALGVEDVVLIKDDGTRHTSRVHAQEKEIFAGPRFPAAHGDTIERTFPSGVVQQYEVISVAPYKLPEPHVRLKVRPKKTAKAAAPAAPDGQASLPEHVQPVEPRLPRLDVTYREKLGTGAYGTVWSAQEQLLERDVAVKFLTSTNQALDEDSLIREARSLAKVTHANLVTVHAAAWLRHPDNGLVAPAIIMELLRGVPLHEWWRTQHDRAEVLRCATGVIAGIQAIHAAGLHHGDLHSQNVLVLRDATPKIIDWRYQDTFLLAPTTARQEVVEQDGRRTNDIIVTLFEKQGLKSECEAVRRLETFDELSRIVGTMVAPPGANEKSSSFQDRLTDPADIAFAVEEWFGRQFNPRSRDRAPQRFRQADVATELNIAEEDLRAPLVEVGRRKGYLITFGEQTFQVTWTEFASALGAPPPLTRR